MQRTLTTLFLIEALAAVMLNCRAQGSWPPDLHVAGLDPPTAVDRSDLIVLALVLGHRDISFVPTPWRGDADPKRLAEVEVTLKPLQVIKGPTVPAEIRFRFYDGRDYKVVTGMPKGASGPIGSSGVFFLNRRADGTFRSAVDIYRPDIQTPWLAVSVQPKQCFPPRECLAELLLSYPDSDSATVFDSRLSKNWLISQQLVGFLRTYDLLSQLVISNRNQDSVKREACSVLAQWYSLEFPAACVPVVGASEALRLAPAFREHLSTGGMAWVRRRIGSDNEADLSRYLDLLANSPDGATRSAATRLRKQKGNGGQ